MSCLVKITLKRVTLLYDTIIHRHSYENAFIPVKLKSFKGELFVVFTG